MNRLSGPVPPGDGQDIWSYPEPSPNLPTTRQARLAPRVLAVAVAVVGLACSACKPGPPHPAPGTPPAASSAVPSGGVPANLLNLAVTPDTVMTTICVPGWTATIRPPASYTTALKARQMAALHLPGTTADYEEDHWIPLELGGAPTAEPNLWPEPWPDARRKDAAENAGRKAVCEGRQTLGDARAAMFTQWGPTRPH